MGKRVDDRTNEQRRTHTVLYGGRDTFMSGWGECRDGVSYAFWACTPADAECVRDWVQSRSDISRLRQVPRTIGRNDHVHIYCVGPGHPALGCRKCGHAIDSASHQNARKGKTP